MQPTDRNTDTNARKWEHGFAIKPILSVNVRLDPCLRLLSRGSRDPRRAAAKKAMAGEPSKRAGRQANTLGKQTSKRRRVAREVMPIQSSVNGSA